MDTELNKACRAITWCLKPTYVEDLYLLAGITPPDIRIDVCARMERTKQMEQETHSMFGHSKKALEVKKGLPDKCETILLPCKSCTM